MIINVSTTKQKYTDSHSQHINAETLFSIEDTLGSRLLDRITQGAARSRPVSIRRERKGYMPTHLGKRV